jgi:hypothetical protein
MTSEDVAPTIQGDCLMELNLLEGQDVTKNVLLKIVVEGWKFSRVYQRLISKLDAGEQSRFTSQVRYFLKQMEENLSEVGITLVNLEGHPFDPGMAATAINLNDFSPNDMLVVDQMLEPVITGKMGLVRMGTVLLRKAGKI